MSWSCADGGGSWLWWFRWCCGWSKGEVCAIPPMRRAHEWGTRGMGGAEEGRSVVAPFGLHSGLRQQGAHPSRKKPRDEWGTRVLWWCGREQVSRFPCGCTPAFGIAVGSSTRWFIGTAEVVPLRVVGRGDGRERSLFARCPHLKIEIWGTQSGGRAKCGPPARSVVAPFGLHSGLGQQGAHPSAKERRMDGAPGLGEDRSLCLPR